MVLLLLPKLDDGLLSLVAGFSLEVELPEDGAAVGLAGGTARLL